MSFRSLFPAILVLSLAACFDTAPSTLVDGGAEGGTGTPSWQLCSGFGSCALEAATCCDACGVVEARDVHAVRVGAESEHASAVCPTPPMSCGTCVSEPNPSLYALCVSLRCTVFDVRAQPLSECTEDTDCVLVDRECCTCSGDYTAVRGDAITAFRGAVCAGASGCMACEDAPPSSLEAFCAADGHCAVRSL